MKIARVFPRQTNMTPLDADCYFEAPGLFTPKYDEVHISVVFNWDMPEARKLAVQWQDYGKVRIGGPACGDPGGDFVPGKYVAQGVVFTSRGCPNKCGKCLVPKREGALRELPVTPGNIIQDNNFLACSKGHREKVYTMLRGQHAIEFRGGVEALRLTPEIAHELAALPIKNIFLACDSPGAIKALSWALYLLWLVGFNRNNLYCYMIVGADMAEEEARLREIYRLGAIPFAQLLQPDEDKIKKYPREWRLFQRRWSRPAIIKNRAKKGWQ